MPEELPERIGAWRVERLLGQGGMAVVYAGVDDTDGTPVAIKWLTRATPLRRARFAEEARVLERLRHPNVVRFRAEGEADGRPYLVYERVEGSDLRVYAEKLRQRPPAERADVARRLARELCDALAHVHALGVVHRDVKPANVLVSREGSAVLTDFGVALSAEDAATAPGGVVGTAAYAAPEQVDGRAVDARADQYGLACTLYLLITGKRPFEFDHPASLIHAHLNLRPRPPSELDPTVPADLERFVLRMLEKDPAARFAGMDEAAAALDAPRSSGIPFAGRQASIDAVASMLDEVAAGFGGMLRFTGARGCGKTWMAALAREAAARRELPCVYADDPEGLEVLAGRVARGDALLVVTDLAHAGARELLLPPLTVADVRRTVHALAPATDNIARVAERLHRWSGGNAGLFLGLAEVCRTTTRGSARLTLADAPPTIDVSAWIDGMDLDETSVAGALAALHLPAREDELEQVALAPAATNLEALVARGVALNVGEGWVLAAEALRAPILELLPDRELTEARAAALERDRAAGEVRDPLLEAVAELVAAGRRAEAIVPLESAAEAAEGARRRTRLGVLAALLWSTAEPRRAQAAWRAVLGERPTDTRALTGVAACNLLFGEVDHARRTLAAALAAASDASARVGALCASAEAASVAGEADEALAHARRAVSIATGLRDRALECAALRHLGAVELAAGRCADAARSLADASALARAVDLNEERVASHVLRARTTLVERPFHRTAGAAALERVLPIVGLNEPDPEGFRHIARAVWAEAAGVLGESALYARARSRALAGLDALPALTALRVRAILARAAVHVDAADAARQAAAVQAEAASIGAFGIARAVG